MKLLVFCFALVTSFSLVAGNAQGAGMGLYQLPDELASYQVQFFKRRNVTNHPIIAGIIYDAPSKKTLPNPAMAVLNNMQVRTDATGHFEKEVNPGVYSVTGRNIFYKNLSVNKLNVSLGDSVVIKFYLQGEPTAN